MLKQVIAANPSHAEAHALLSSLYGQQIGTSAWRGMTLGQRASSSIEAALKLAPDNPRVVLQSGIGAFFTPTGYGTLLAEGKETREINGRNYVLEHPIHADFALIKAERGDRWGNLTYRMTARNFGPVMAMAAKTTIATVHEIVPLGSLDPEAVVTPGLFVQRIVLIDRVATSAGGFKQQA